MKKPWLAALLNILPGAGYLYLGVRKVFAWLLLAACPGILIVGVIVDPDWITAYEEMPFYFWDIASLLLASLAFMADAFLEAKRVNQAFQKNAS